MSDYAGEQMVTLDSAPPQEQTVLDAYMEAEKHFSEEIKPFLDHLKVLRDAVVNEVGIGVYFQSVDGIVYCTTMKKGQWVDFTPYEIKRTRRAGEKAGSLSVTEAEEAGFIVPKQPTAKELEDQNAETN